MPSWTTRGGAMTENVKTPGYPANSPREKPRVSTSVTSSRPRHLKLIPQTILERTPVSAYRRIAWDRIQLPVAKQPFQGLDPVFRGAPSSRYERFPQKPFPDWTINRSTVSCADGCLPTPGSS